MAVIFAGGELTSFVRFNAVETTTSSTFRTPARCGIHTQKNGYIRTTSLGGRSDIWIHFELNIGLSQAGKTPIVVKNSIGVTVFSIDSNGTLSVGGTVLSSINLWSTTGRFTYDIHLRGGIGGVIEIYCDSQIMFTQSGTYNTIADMDTVTFSPVGDDSTSTTNSIWSQIIIADEITVGWKLATLVIESAGSSTQFLGTVSDINEIVLDDNTFISANSADLINTWNVSDLDPIYTNIKAVVIAALSKYTGTGPKNMDAVVRINTVNYYTPFPALTVGYAPGSVILPIDPSTGSSWTRAKVNTIEYGLKSKF